MAISRFLNLTTTAQNELQTYASYMAVELHQREPNEYFVEVNFLQLVFLSTKLIIVLASSPIESVPPIFGDIRMSVALFIFGFSETANSDSNGKMAVLV